MTNRKCSETAKRWILAHFEDTPELAQEAWKLELRRAALESEAEKRRRERPEKRAAFEKRLKEAREQKNQALCISIKREAAAAGVVLA